MCRIVQVSSLDSKAKEFVDSLGGQGIVMDREEEEDREEIRKDEDEDKDTAWDMYLEREPVALEEEGLW